MFVLKQISNDSGNEDDFRRLLIFGANFNATDEKGNTALLLAVEKGNEKTARSFDFDHTKEKFSISTISNKIQRQPIHFHLNTTGEETMIKMLIEDGADINAINKDKNSALIIAATEGRKQSLT